MNEVKVTIKFTNFDIFKKLVESTNILKDMKESYPWDENIEKLIENYTYLMENLEAN